MKCSNPSLPKRRRRSLRELRLASSPLVILWNLKCRRTETCHMRDWLKRYSKLRKSWQPPRTVKASLRAIFSKGHRPALTPCHLKLHSNKMICCKQSQVRCSEKQLAVVVAAMVVGAHTCRQSLRQDFKHLRRKESLIRPRMRDCLLHKIKW